MIRRMLAMLLALMMLLGCAAAEGVDKAETYAAAVALYEDKEYEQAAAAFESLGSYKDSASLLSKCKWYIKEERYAEGVALYKAKDYYAARDIFEELGSFKESKKQLYNCELAILKIEYEQAAELTAAGEYQQALELYKGMNGYSDSKKKITELEAILAQQQLDAYEAQCYEEALALKESGDLDAARDMFIQAGDHADSTDQLYLILEAQAPALVYARAELEMGYGNYKEAYVRYKALEGYQDSAEKAADAWQKYLQGIYDMAASAEDANRAMLLYLSLGDFADAAQRAAEIIPSVRTAGLYAAAQQLRKDDYPAAAAIGYDMCEDYQESKSYAAQMHKDAQSYWQFEHAHILTQLWQVEEANAIYRELGDYKYAARMGIERPTALQLRDYATSEYSDTFTAPDGSTHRYRIYKGVPLWIEARAFCEALGGHLATITTPEENRFVFSFMRACGNTTAYFGLMDEDRDGTWEWVNGEPVEYLNWHRGEPSYSPRERYGMFFYKHVDGDWNDAHFYEDDKWGEPGCSYICEWDL